MLNKRKNPAVFYIASFFLPAVLIMAALAGLKITPFGDNTMLLSDANGLYINYMGYVGRVLKGQESVLFSFEKGLGGNMMGSWGWFLLNPFFALFAMADITNYPQVLTWVSILNFCLSGLTMYILLKDLYGHKADNLIFSTAYAMNGFLVSNFFNINFFTGVPTLPLVVLGLRRILDDKNPLLYILALGYALFTNFYFGFMLCAASLMIFLAFFVADRGQIANVKAVALKYAVSSLLAGMVSALIWLPALLSLRGGRLDQSITDFISLKENMPFLQIFTKLFIGANSKTQQAFDGLPNIFVGILPVFLVILFFMNKKITKARKTAAAVLLSAYLLSFYLAIFNIVMHGGTVTNWFNYRDSFVFCFLMLMIAAEEWQHITDEALADLKRAAVILILGTMIVLSRQFEYITGGLVIFDFAILALMFLAYWMHKTNPEKNPKQTLTMVVLVLMCGNLYLNYYFSTKSVMDWTRSEKEYQGIVVPVGALADAIQESDKGFYRMEVGEQRSGNTGNDPMLFGYNGVGHGGSDDRDFVRLALSELGVHRFNMRNNYGQGVTSATDTLLGLKYIIAKTDLTEEKGYEKLVDIGEWTLYKNPHPLPIAVLADTAVSSVKLDLEDIFENLNMTWSAMTGSNDRIFVEENDITFVSHNITEPMELKQAEAASIVRARDAEREGGTSANRTDTENALSTPASVDEKEISPEYSNRGTLHEKPENTHYIKYSWTAGRDGAVYTYNRSGMTEDNGSTNPALNYEGYYHKGDTITGYIPVTGTFVSEYLLEDVAGRFRAVYVDDTVLEEMSQILLDRPSVVEKISDRHLRGSFTAQEGQELLFTIPFDEGWTLTVDGKETELQQVLGVFMAAEVEPGMHTYEMKFVPAGLKLGMVSAGISTVLIVCYIYLDKKKRGAKAL